MVITNFEQKTKHFFVANHSTRFRLPKTNILGDFSVNFRRPDECLDAFGDYATTISNTDLLLSHLDFRSVSFFLIAPFPDHCLLLLS